MEEAVLRPARQFLTPRTLTALLSALVALLLGIAIWLGVVVWTERSADNARQEAVAAARQFAVSLQTVDHRTFARDLKQLQSLATGQMLAVLTADESAMKEEIVAQKLMSKAEAIEAGIVKLEGDAARVLVSLAVDPLNAQGKPAGPPQFKRLQLDLTRVDGKWLVSTQQYVA